MLKEELVNKIENIKCISKAEGRMTAKDLSILIYPNNKQCQNKFPNKLSQYKSDVIKELSFIEVYSLLKFFYPNEYLDVMSKWCYEFRRYENLKCSMEFASSQRNFELLRNLIKHIEDMNSNSKDLPELKLIAKIYSILLNHQQGCETSLTEKKLNEINPCDTDAAVLYNILKCNVSVNNYEFKRVPEKLKTVDNMINGIKNEYLRSQYELRTYEIYAQVNLFTYNDVKKARYYINSILFSEIGAAFKSYGYILLGMSFLNESCEQCLKYFENVFEINSKMGRLSKNKTFKDTDVAFVKNIWGKLISADETDDISEKAHFYAREGDAGKTIKLLDEAVEKFGNSPFKMMYRGIALKDEKIITQAISAFLSNGNVFYANVAYGELRKITNDCDLIGVVIENFKI